MKITVLTAAQQTEVTTLKAALATAMAAAAPYNKVVAEANVALNTYLNTTAGISGAPLASRRFGQGVQVSEDGTALVVMN